MVRLFGRARARAHEAAAETSDASGAEDREACLADQPERSVCTFTGALTRVGLRPLGTAEALEAVLDDGTDAVTLVWLGQRRIAGIEAGRRLTVHGRIGRRGHERIVYNPRYELHP